MRMALGIVGFNVDTVKEQHQRARKDYPCDSCRFIVEYKWSDLNFTLGEWAAITKAKRDGCAIKSGDRYVKQISMAGGFKTVLRAIHSIHAICIKYRLYALEG